MKKKLLVRKIFTAILTMITVISMSAGSVLASGTDHSTFKKSRSSSYASLSTVGRFAEKENIKVKDKFLNSEGKIEQVIRVNKDGSFMTEEMNLHVKGKKAACSHPLASLVAIANLPQETKNVATSACCFKYRSVTKNRCKQCGNSSVKTYGAWASHKKHNYPLFGKKCKTCGYKK